MATTTQYGSWARYVDGGGSTVEDTIAQYVGEFGADFDVVGLADAYRSAINAQFGDARISLHGNDFYGELGADAGAISTAIEAVDLGSLAEQHDRALA
jgi:hypothetical protein